MKDYKELIKQLEFKFKRELKVNKLEFDTDTMIFISPLYRIDKPDIEIIKEYCDYYTITTNNKNQIILLIKIDKIEREDE